jgi:hypothetical protein
MNPTTKHTGKASDLVRKLDFIFVICSTTAAHDRSVRPRESARVEMFTSFDDMKDVSELWEYLDVLEQP